MTVRRKTRCRTAFDYYSDSRPEPDRIKIETINSGSHEGNLLMFRDSFGNALYPFLADTFSYCAFRGWYLIGWTGFPRGFDYVVVEIVERNLKNLAVKAPVMPAPAISYNDDVKSENGVWRVRCGLPEQRLTYRRMFPYLRNCPDML